VSSDAPEWWGRTIIDRKGQPNVRPGELRAYTRHHEPDSQQLSSNTGSRTASLMEIVEPPLGNSFLACHFFGSVVACVRCSSPQHGTTDLSSSGIAALGFWVQTRLDRHDQRDCIPTDEKIFNSLATPICFVQVYGVK
jgi:hypothetical protein